MTDRLAMRRQGGWSLLEAATLLAVAGLFGVMLWNLLPVLRQAGGAPAQQAALEQARQALTGFVQSHGRLPWPAPPGSNDGLENAAAAGGAQALLPWKTLGLAADPRLGYQVRGALTSPAAVSFTPANPALPATELARTQRNDLDFCADLVRLQRADGAAATPPHAFAVSAQGDGQDAAPLRQETGVGELAAQLHCPAYLARAAGAAHSAFAAQDLRAIAALYATYSERHYDIRVAERDYADYQVSMAQLTVMLATYQVAHAAAMIAGMTIGTASAVISMGKSTAVLAAAGYSLKSASDTRDEKDKALDRAMVFRAATHVYQARVEDYARNEIDNAQLVLGRGLQP
ncbi:type II secretion system protein [Bordetella bronchiseptica]|uniref:type II secretion system protein n=1 Tax=Bordetella bronchiseptica TaxID=518 RepID=UPI00123B4D17|nr:hypothetical protein [Bordetella bronchiseptica]QET69067.1 hypothetical protein FOB42_01930 [Bordetella bronchiseptica]